MIDTELRNGTLGDLAERLKAQQVVKMDAVVPATAIRSIRGELHVAGMGSSAPETLEEALEGKPGAAGIFAPGPIMVGQIADSLSIPVKYLRKLAETRTDLFDANVNGWLHGYRTVEGIEPCENDPRYQAPDGRRFLVRTFLDADGGTGFGRALLSPTYNPIDNLDPLIAFLSALREVDPEAEVVTCNLSETRMTVRVASPTITANAPLLMENYRPVTPGWSPQGPNTPAKDRRVGDIVSAGMLFGNSETGNGAFVLIPEVTVWACTNGMTRTEDQVRRVHLGARMDEGIVQWSTETRQRNLELVTSMTKDAVRQYMNTEYLQKVVAEVEAKAGLALPEPAKAVEVIAKQLAFSDDTAALVLDHFIKGAQGTTGGMMNAVTSAAQVVASADLAHDLEASAFRVLDIAHSLATA